MNIIQVLNINFFTWETVKYWSYKHSLIKKLINSRSLLISSLRSQNKIKLWNQIKYSCLFCVSTLAMTMRAEWGRKNNHLLSQGAKLYQGWRLRLTLCNIDVNLNTILYLVLSITKSSYVTTDQSVMYVPMELRTVLLNMLI